MEQRSTGLRAWMDRLNEAELPALAAVIQDLQRLSEADKSSVQQLAAVLLRDATLTSKVLRVGNSVYYNPSQESIRTISRAIVLIGFDSVRLISLSVCLIDSLLSKSPREQLRGLLARSFHAAVQARNIAGQRLPGRQEEVFIAALLHQIGELAFWGCGGEQADELAALLEQASVQPGQAVLDVLGVSFRQLTQELVKSWNLGDIASLAQSGAAQSDPAVRAVTLGTRISEAALQGWSSPAMAALVEQLARLLGISEDAALQQVLASADEAVEVATTFGASKLCDLIPSTDPELIQAQRQAQTVELLQPDLTILQQAAQDLALMVSDRADVGLVLDTALKGLHQGAGLERVMLAVLAEQQSCFRAKRVAGEGTQQWMEGFRLPAAQDSEVNVFGYALRHREAIWMGVPASYNLNELVTLPMRQMLGQGMFFIAPLMAGKREIGVLYADCRVSGRPLTQEQFAAFQRFTQLTGRCLEAISRRA
ncbi:HDOD domain-containing protein [Pseudomonas sp. LRF_L74]|uniref:HDOD domain-containing protein n=1 Tax=Pseudomonas sp. LRF_L74 TaxID=3369422 RepID=UPI003F5EB541